MGDRTLTDQDVEAIAAAMEKRMMKRIDEGLGRGVRGYLTKIAIWMVIALAVYGWAKGIRP